MAVFVDKNRLEPTSTMHFVVAARRSNLDVSKTRDITYQKS
jgi:hypothetical protein